MPPLLKEYCQYRQSHYGVADRTLLRDVDTARGFLTQLRRGRKPIERATLEDVDAFVGMVAARVSKGTVADTCSSLRAFLRFLHTTGRLPSDLASGVIAPRFRLSERPPRTLPWGDVKRILQSIRRSETPGKRDYAILLLILHARLPWLSAYMGHMDIVGTETYLNATPEVLDLAGKRLRRRFRKTVGKDFINA